MPLDGTDGIKTRIVVEDILGTCKEVEVPLRSSVWLPEFLAMSNKSMNASGMARKLPEPSLKLTVTVFLALTRMFQVVVATMPNLGMSVRFSLMGAILPRSEEH